MLASAPCNLPTKIRINSQKEQLNICNVVENV